MAVVSIHYKEGKHRNWKNFGYKGVEISYDNLNQTKTFNSGDFIKDWYDCNKFIIHELADSEGHFSNSSSVDHFIMDGAPFHSAYLHKKEGTDGEGKDDWELLYWDEKIHNYMDHSYIFDKGIEFFVDKDTKPTWAELREKYKSHEYIN